MKRKLILAASTLLSAAALAPIAPSRDQRANLLPLLQPGQTLTYLIRFRSNKNVKTESTLVIPLAPTASQGVTRALLRLQILDVQQTAGWLAVHARRELLGNETGEPSAKEASQKRKAGELPLEPDGKTVEFTISASG